MPTLQQLNELTDKIIGCAIEVHRTLGPGLLESCYKAALAHELRLQGLNALTEVSVPLTYKGIELENSFRADIIVENKVIIELKATEQDNKLYTKQLYTYLRLLDLRVGLLINFNRTRLIDGLDRIINNNR